MRDPLQEAVTSEFDDYQFDEDNASDQYEQQAVQVVRGFVEANREEVFSSRQIEVTHEQQFFHWVTNRAIRDLIEEGTLQSEMRPLGFGGSVKLIWHRSNRYPKRKAAKLVELIDEYSNPNISGALGIHGESMVLEAFARERFLMVGRETSEYGGKSWPDTAHDLDFVFERDGQAYGVEVKNTLSYMEHEELQIKVEMCRGMGIRPVIVARMLPKTWVYELREAGGFGLLLKHQLYPWTHRDLARRVREEMGLPVDAPRSLEAGTMARFVAWHDQVVNV